MDRKVGDPSRICAYRWQWRECEECGEPAVYKTTFLLPNCRANPASSAYRRDDCTYCSDREMFVCEEHQYIGIAGLEHCSIIPLSRFPYMGWYEIENEEISEELRELWEEKHG